MPSSVLPTLANQRGDRGKNGSAAMRIVEIFQILVGPDYSTHRWDVETKSVVCEWE
jgi:hypothetical protein